MSCRGIDYYGIRVLNEGNGLDCGCIWQTKKGYVGRVERVSTGRDILAKFFWQDDRLKVRAGRNPLANPESGRTGRAVYEDALHAIIPTRLWQAAWV